MRATCGAGGVVKEAVGGSVDREITPSSRVYRSGRKERAGKGDSAGASRKGGGERGERGVLGAR